MLNLATRYYYRIISLNDCTLVKMSCYDTSSCPSDANWRSYMDNICHRFGGTQLLKTSMEEKYRDNWYNVLNSNPSTGKLRVYSKFKKSFELENYLLQFPTHIRRNFSKLRISAHNLAIETGRYTKPVQTPIEKRTCFHCNEIETE